jgi:hypothetical protein
MGRSRGNMGRTTAQRCTPIVKGESMRQPIFAALAVSVALTASSSAVSYAQTRPTVQHVSSYLPIKLVSPSGWAVAGKWTYRSYLDRPDVIVNDDANSAAKALSLLFGEGTMTLSTPSATKITGTFDMGGGYVLDLTGTIKVSASGQTAIHMTGPGRPNTPTAGWEYDYDGVLTERWPKGVGQIPAIVGSVFRAKPHGSAKAGVVASFIAVKQQ